MFLLPRGAQNSFRRSLILLALWIYCHAAHQLVFSRKIAANCWQEFPLAKSKARVVESTSIFLRSCYKTWRFRTELFSSTNRSRSQANASIRCRRRMRFDTTFDNPLIDDSLWGLTRLRPIAFRFSSNNGRNVDFLREGVRSKDNLLSGTGCVARILRFARANLAIFVLVRPADCDTRWILIITLRSTKVGSIPSAR